MHTFHPSRLALEGLKFKISLGHIEGPVCGGVPTREDCLDVGLIQ